MSRGRKKTIEVETLTHAEAKRRNIPTAEFESVMRDERSRRYSSPMSARNRDLDPQLVWRGKDEQDWSDLIVSRSAALHPGEGTPQGHHRRSTAADEERAKESAGRAIDLFGDFNGLHDMEAATEFYAHDQHWSNRMISGDSSGDGMPCRTRRAARTGAVHLSRPALRHQVQLQLPMVDDSRDVKDGEGSYHARARAGRAFRDTWRDGIHSYLTYLRDR